MCVAVPCRVMSVDEDRAQVECNGNRMTVHTGLIEARVGDYVLVHAGCAIEVMDKDGAAEILELLAELTDGSVGVQAPPQTPPPARQAR